MHGQLLEPHVNGEAEEQSENAEQNSEKQQRVAICAEELHLRQVRKFQVGLAAHFSIGLSESRGPGKRHQSEGGRECLSESAS